MRKIIIINFFVISLLNVSFAETPKGLEIGKGLATTFAHGSAIDGCKADKMDQQNNQTSASGKVLSR